MSHESSKIVNSEVNKAETLFNSGGRDLTYVVSQVGVPIEYQCNLCSLLVFENWNFIAFVLYTCTRRY